jgi:hypothetical protein
MSYTQTLFDNFDDNSINTTLWAVNPDGTSDSTAVAETSQQLQITAKVGYGDIAGKTYKDVTTGIIWAAQVSKSAAATSGNTEVYIGLNDASNNGVQLLSVPASNFSSWDHNGATTVTTGTVTGGIWNTGWTNGTWFGMSISGTTVTAYKSTDGQTWTSIGTTTVGGTFAKTACSIRMTCGDFGTTQTFKTLFDNVSFFTPGSAIPGKVRSGGAWVKPTAAKVRSGGAWVTPTATKVRSGGAWVVPTN